MKVSIKIYVVVLICLYGIYLIQENNILTTNRLLVILLIILVIVGLRILFITGKPINQETVKNIFWKKYNLAKIMETDGKEAAILELKTISFNSDVPENDRIIASQLLELYIKANKFI